MSELNFKIKEGTNLVEDMDYNSKEYENAPCAPSFWTAIDDGEAEIFINLLEDENTQNECYKAINILSKLENAVESYVVWM